jgi:hypothetical protein
VPSLFIGVIKATMLPFIIYLPHGFRIRYVTDANH